MANSYTPACDKSNSAAVQRVPHAAPAAAHAAELDLAWLEATAAAVADQPRTIDMHAATATVTAAAHLLLRLLQPRTPAAAWTHLYG
jgi:hypothetical protein